MRFAGTTGCVSRAPTHTQTMAKELAEQAWFLRVKTSEVKPAILDFAVGKATLSEAISAVLYHPQLEPGDQVTLTSQMTPVEISSCRIRPDEVRTYGRRIRGAGNDRWLRDEKRAASR